MSEKMKISGGQIAAFVAVMSMYFMAPTHSAINVASAGVMATYGVDANAVSYLVSITNLLEVPAAFVIGLIAGRKLSYRWCALIATALTFIGGLPAVFGASMSFEVLMATRCILGLGLGCYMPVVLGVVSIMFQKDTVRASMMSIASVVFSIGMILITNVAGFLGAISWQYAWGVYLFALVPFVLCVFLLTPKNVPAVPASDEKGEKVKIKLPVVGWGLLVMFLCGIIMSQSLFNIGGATIAAAGIEPVLIGTIFSCFSVGALISAALFSPVYKYAKGYVIPVFWIIGMVGYVLWYVAHVTGNTVLFFAAIILAGFGTNTMTIGVPMLLSTFVSPAIVGAVMGFSYVFQNGGGFVASPIDQLVTSIFGVDALMSSVWIFNLVLGVCITVVLLFIAKKVNVMAKAEEAAE